MAHQGGSVLSLEGRLAAYNYPTYRYCRVCEIIDFMDFRQADRIRNHLGEAWGDMVCRIKKNPRSFGFSEVYFNETKPLPDYHEGPAESFPEFKARLSFDVIVKAIATVCVPPHHSKLWIRVSSVDGDSGASFNEEQLDRFYSKASIVCERMAELLSDEYRRALAKEDLEDKLIQEHEISIETASSDLNMIADFLQDDSMKMASILRDQTKFRSLSGFIRRVCEKRIDKADEIGDDVKWFKMRVSKSEHDELRGIYSRRHGSNVTKFVGLVNRTSESDAHRISREFSKKLVQHIAPVI